MKLVHENQYGLIKNKSIQDCLGWAFEYLYQCKHSRRGIVVLKLDFEKAFDVVEHLVILKMMEAKGFPARWIKWVHDILSSAKSSVILNGVPSKEFNCKRGVRQGDPLSPLLFVLAADLLQSIINKAFDDGSLAPPFPQNSELPFRIVQYVDDTLLVLQGQSEQLIALKNILQLFALSTGLNINYQKSCLVPINISNERAIELAAVFGCSLGSFPFTYLGLPLGTTKPQVKDFAPLICRVERWLSASS